MVQMNERILYIIFPLCSYRVNKQVKGLTIIVDMRHMKILKYMNSKLKEIDEKMSKIC